MKLSYGNIELNKQTITYLVLVLAILYLLLRKSLLVVGLLMFYIVRWIVFLIGLYYVVYDDKTTGLLIILLLVVAIYTHSYIPTSVTKESFENPDDPDDPDYKAAVDAQERKEAEEQRKRDLVQETAIDKLPPRRAGAKAKPRKKDVELKTDRYVPDSAKDVSDDIRKLHERFHATVERTRQ
jgi:hypothetical protein